MVLSALPLACAGESEEGRLAPAFRLDDIRDGRPAVELVALRGRPVLLNFWGSWCAPCEEELPDLVQVWEEVRDRVAFVGVDGRDSRRRAVAMADRLGAAWPSAYDPDDRVYTAYRLRGRPVTVLIDEDGRIVRSHQGVVRSAQELRDLLREAFGDEVLAAP